MLPTFSQPTKILVADDDREIRLGVADLLAPLGVTIVQAESGPDAVQVALTELVDAMVLDVHMPGCTGIDVLITLRQQVSERAIPCIFCTGQPSSALEHAAREAGAWAFLRKPIQPDLLREEVVNALRHSQNQ